MKNVIILFTLFLSFNTKAFDISVSLDGKNEKATIFSPHNQAIKAILILTPTIAGVSSLERTNANFFAKNGFLVIIPLPYFNQIDSETPDTQLLDQEFNKPYLLALKFLEESEKVLKLKPNLPVFVLGASQGGFRSLIIASYLNRVKALWFATAGVDYPSIYARSKVDKIAKFRSNHKKILGLITDEEYEFYLRNHLQNDMQNICTNILVPFVQVIALKDEKVPTYNQELLNRACPANETIRLNTGHLGGSISTVVMRKRILKFFLGQLN
jgi:hypothetical protein